MAPRDNIALLLYVPPKVKAEIERRAREEDRSVSSVGRRLLAAALELDGDAK